MSDAERHYSEDDQPMTSELAKKHTKFDELMRELESDPAHAAGLAQARIDVAAYFTEMGRRRDVVRAALRSALLEEFVEDYNIRDPGTLANTATDAILHTVLCMLNDDSLTRDVPMSTETKVEM